jgi:hypothetical protein
MKLLLLAYPRWWRERYADELLALLEAEPLTWRVRGNVVAAGLRQRLRGSGPPQVKVLRAWSLFVIGGMAFQKTAEHWQVVVARGDRAVPTAAFHTVEAAAFVGSAAVLAGVVLALPAFLRDLRRGGWTAVRSPILVASTGTAVATAALAAVALDRDTVAASVFVAFAAFSLVAWTHAAALAARRLEQIRAHSYLALTVTASMVSMTVATAVWLASVARDAPSFVGTAQLALIATFMLAGTTLAATGTARSLRA